MTLLIWLYALALRGVLYHYDHIALDLRLFLLYRRLTVSTVSGVSMLFRPPFFCSWIFCRDFIIRSTWSWVFPAVTTTVTFAWHCCMLTVGLWNNLLRIQKLKKCSKISSNYYLSQKHQRGTLTLCLLSLLIHMGQRPAQRWFSKWTWWDSYWLFHWF